MCYKKIITKNRLYTCYNGIRPMYWAVICTPNKGYGASICPYVRTPINNGSTVTAGISNSCNRLSKHYTYKVFCFKNYYNYVSF